jgi:hypothetical protein
LKRLVDVRGFEPLPPGAPGDPKQLLALHDEMIYGNKSLIQPRWQAAETNEHPFGPNSVKAVEVVKAFVEKYGLATSP